MTNTRLGATDALTKKQFRVFTILSKLKKRDLVFLGECHGLMPSYFKNRRRAIWGLITASKFCPEGLTAENQERAKADFERGAHKK